MTAISATLGPVLPPELMTAAERAGFRAACALMRIEADRIARSAEALEMTGAPASDHDLLRKCGRMVRLVADRTEGALTARISRPVSLGAGFAH